MITGFDLSWILDSDGYPTVQVLLTTADGIVSKAVPPSSALFTVAPELEDGWSDSLVYFNKIFSSALIGMDVTEQTAIDNIILQQVVETFNNCDWCERRLVLMLAQTISLAVCKAGAVVLKIPLYMYYTKLASNPKLVFPFPAFNLMNMLGMQKFMILPVGTSSFKETMKMVVEVHRHLNAVIKKKYGLDGPIISWPPLSEFVASPLKVAMKMGVEVYHYLKAVIKKKDATNVGDEVGLAPNIEDNKEGLELLKTAIAKAGCTGKVVIGMDAIASEFNGEDNRYEENNDGLGGAVKDLYWKSYWEHYKNIMAESFIVSIEDRLDQDDWEHFSKLTAELGEKVQIVGDDLEVDQFGSVTESIEAVKMSDRVGLVFMTTISFV